MQRVSAWRKPLLRTAGLPSGAGFPRAARILAAGSREAALTLVAVLGLTCILSLILGFFFKASFVVFRTGSMEPLYPVGALALTVQVNAKDLAPGDVVSVRREAASALVTHRVVSVNPPSAKEATASLRLRGDANISDDPLPYEVATAQKVLVTVPGLGAWVMASRGPEFVGVATLGVTALVTWAYWPRRGTARPVAVEDETPDDTQKSGRE